MQYHTHIAFSGMIGLSVVSLIPVTDPTMYIIGLTVGAILPDIDHPKSKISNKIPIIPSLVSTIFTHRTFFHSVLFLVCLTLLYGFFPQSIVTGIIIGAAGHIIGDMLTPAGVKLLYPFGNYIRFPFNFKTGGVIEQICFLLFTIVTIKLIH
ncbi:metal-dependent hydrolase [Bacillus sp. SCS-151]|uniref:metal-dependent hydrolase n=1 Tax=Nanhaiella sioensis TaxID=3115293 RepID=UPI003979E8CC